MKAHAKINLALLVGPARHDGKHEVATVLQRVDLCDHVQIEPAETPRVDGFSADTLVRDALAALAAAVGAEPHWHASIDKRVPVAAGLGGGSSDAATALQLANATLDRPLSAEQLHDIARTLGADVPFFLTAGPRLGTGDGTTLEPVDLRQDYTCVLCLPDGDAKESTAAVYARFDEFGGAEGFDERHARLLAALAANDLAAFPANDLSSSPVAAELTALGAFRADVSGAGPTVYGLFDDPGAAAAAGRALAARGRVWITRPAW